MCTECVIRIQDFLKTGLLHILERLVPPLSYDDRVNQMTRSEFTAAFQTLDSFVSSPGFYVFCNYAQV